MISPALSPLGPKSHCRAHIFAQAPHLCGANSLSPLNAPPRRIELRAKPENMHP
ncbi:MAG: hypothetical protein ACJA2X_002772 [Halocynthiibacter sp.]|jgi:hypothetical protein